jgi:hypothetical protein
MQQQLMTLLQQLMPLLRAVVSCASLGLAVVFAVAAVLHELALRAATETAPAPASATLRAATGMGVAARVLVDAALVAQLRHCARIWLQHQRCHAGIANVTDISYGEQPPPVLPPIEDVALQVIVTAAAHVMNARKHTGLWRAAIVVAAFVAAFAM